MITINVTSFRKIAAILGRRPLRKRKVQVSLPALEKDVRTGVSYLVVLLVAGTSLYTLSGCEEADALPTVDSYIEKSGIHDDRKIRIGILDNQPLVSQKENDTYSGFEADIARYLAGGLGFKPEDITWVPLKTEDRFRAVEGGDVELAVANITMTRKNPKNVDYVGPYLITGQEAIVPVAKKNQLTTIESLKSARVCTTGGSTSADNLKEEGVTPLPESTYALCVEKMLQNKYDAVSTDETLLAGYMHVHPGKFALVDLPIDKTEDYGIAIAKNKPELKALLSHFLRKSFSQNDDSNPWRRAWNNTLGLELGMNQTQPVPRVPENPQELRDKDDERENSQGRANVLLRLSDATR